MTFGLLLVGASAGLLRGYDQGFASQSVVNHGGYGAGYDAGYNGYGAGYGASYGGYASPLAYAGHGVQVGYDGHDEYVRIFLLYHEIGRSKWISRFNSSYPCKNNCVHKKLSFSPN